MPTESYTETSHNSFGSRIVNSFKGILVGIILFLGTIALLWWNEGNLVQEKFALKEVKEKLIPANIKQISASNDGKLLYLTGLLQSLSPIGDDELIKAANYLILERNVEMYQWKEDKEEKTEKKIGGSEDTVTTYKYETGWHSGRIDSEGFHRPSGHENPELAVSENIWRNPSSSFGDYNGASILEKVSANTELILKEDMLIGNLGSLESGKIVIKKSSAAKEPQVGDVRVSYKVLLPGTFSVIAQQENSNQLVAYVASNSKEEFLVSSGTKSSDQLITSAESDSKMLAWILRVVGFFLMWAGLSIILAPIPTLLDVLPFLGSIGRGFLGFITGIISFILSIAVIFVSMIAHNIFALILTIILVLGAFIWWLKKKGASKPT